MKAFADDLSLLNCSSSDHQKDLVEIDAKCGELGLVVRPDKCVSMSFDGSKMESFGFSLSAGSTAFIQKKPTKVLDQTLGEDILSSKKAASKKLSIRFRNTLASIDSEPIRGEFKVWLLKHYVAPSMLFLFAVDKFSSLLFQTCKV